MYSIHFDISDNYVDHTNYISPELRESLLDQSATFNFGFEIPENGLYVSDVSESLVDILGCESSTSGESDSESDGSAVTVPSVTVSVNVVTADSDSDSGTESYYSPMSVSSD